MITQFIQEIKSRGLARTNRYEVYMPFTQEELGDNRLVSLFCEAVNLPGMNIATQPSRIYGEVREMPYERIFDPVTLTFYVDSDMTVKAAIERWIHSIVNQTSRTLEYYNNYVRPIVIHVKKVSENDPPPYIITLYEAYPKSIQSIQMSADSRDIMKVTVQIQYKYWVSSAAQNNMSSVSPYTDVDNKTTSSVPKQDPLSVFTGTGVPVSDTIGKIFGRGGGFGGGGASGGF